MTRIRKGYVATSAGQAHYRTAGESSAPAILMLHQTASSSAMYEPLMERLGAEYFLFAPDTPGFGGTFFPAEVASIALYAQVLREAMKWRQSFVNFSDEGLRLGATNKSL